MAQQIPLDTWRSHFSYSHARLIERANNTVFCVAENGLFSLDITTSETRSLGKENGLGDVGASAIHYASDLQKLIIGYPSGVIDFISADGKITTVTTLRDSPIAADKAILDITSAGNDVFMATSFGVVRANGISETINENYRNIGIGGAQLSIREVEVLGDSLYVVSADGIQAGNLADNLLDFNDWVPFSETEAEAFTHLTRTGNKLFAVASGTDMWSFDGADWSATGIILPANVLDLYFGQALIALTQAAVYDARSGSSIISSEPLLVDGQEIIQYADDYWVADQTNGLLRIGSSVQVIKPSSPLSDRPSRIRSVSGHTFAFYGPSPAEYAGGSDQLGYSYFQNGKWRYRTIAGFANITDVAAFGQSFIFSSMGFGLFDDLTGTRLDQSNTSLVVGNEQPGVPISAIANYGNAAWAVAYDSPNTLYKVETNLNITAYTTAQTGFQFPTDIDITSLGVIWSRRSLAEGGGIGVFDPAFEQKRTIRTPDGLPSNAVTGISIDTENEAWIGTSAGIGNYISASFPFNSFGVTIPIFEGRFLFEDEIINDVLTDGGDRIWVATNTGVWVLSRDVSGVVHRFTQENSPLPSDVVRSLAYDGLTGEVFILTDKGLVSYRSGSSSAGVVQGAVIRVFPNPVRTGYDGTVGITGLVRNATVKVTDTMGRLVADIQANGGTASWDLLAFNGARVQPGIYLLFSSDETGKETMVGKIAVIR